MLSKEPEMLQRDAFCEHTMQQNATAAGPDGGSYIIYIRRSSGPPVGFQGPLHGEVGEEGKGQREEGKRMEGEGSDLANTSKQVKEDITFFTFTNVLRFFLTVIAY